MPQNNIIEEKKIAGEKAVEFIKENTIVGIGTGTTVYYAIKKIGAMIKEGLKIKCVSTSNETTKMALSLNIPLISINEIDKIDLTIDGADEVDKNLNGIKGGGGALLFEKIVALNSKKTIWVVDSTKTVDKLGKIPLPVEIIPFGYKNLFEKFIVEKLNPVLRKNGDEICVTDAGHYIFDLHLDEIKDPLGLNNHLKSFTGIVETGLFINMASSVIVGKGEKTEITERKKI